MLGIAADQRARQGDDLAAGSDQSSSRMALGCIGSFLFVNLIEDEILEDSSAADA